MASPRLAAAKGNKPTTLYVAAETMPSIKPGKRKLASGVLAQINHRQDIIVCASGTQTPKTLITTIKVMSHPHHVSIKEFRAEFFLKDKVDTKWSVGSLHAQTIDRQTQGISQPLYTSELLDWNLKRPLCHASESKLTADETQTIIRHIFHHTGAPRAEYQDRPLHHTDVHFIAEFEISDEYRGPGLAQLAMKAYHKAVQELSGGYAFKGTVVLSPAALRDVFGAKAGWQKPAKSYVEIEHALIASYRKSGYKVWTKADDALEGSGVTIMGRTIGEVDFRQEDTAAEAIFPPFAKLDHCAPAKDGKDKMPALKQESAVEKKLASRGGIRKEVGVKKQHQHPKPSRKHISPVEALDNIDSRRARRVYYNRTERRDINECGLKKWSLSCKLCGVIGSGRWHAWDCDVWTADRSR